MRTQRPLKGIPCDTNWEETHASVMPKIELSGGAKIVAGIIIGWGLLLTSGITIALFEGVKWLATR